MSCRQRNNYVRFQTSASSGTQRKFAFRNVDHFNSKNLDVNDGIEVHPIIIVTPFQLHSRKGNIPVTVGTTVNKSTKVIFLFYACSRFWLVSRIFETSMLLA